MSEEVTFPGLAPNLAEALRARGFTALTAVQERVLEPSLADRDLRISSQTGSGKTLAVGFVLAPLVEGARELRALLIAPTRELAAQLGRELSWLYEPLGAKVVVVAGGANPRDEVRALQTRPAVVVATPGRLIDHMERGAIDPSTVRALVLDEADQLLDLGFRDELEAIVSKLPEERRTHLVSATFSREVLALAERYQGEAVRVEGSTPGAFNADITHVAHVVRPSDTLSALINILLMAPDERALLFVRTRADAADLAECLTRAGFFSLPLSGELEQRERNKTLEAFRSGAVWTLVATDVAARGLDIPDVARVIHVDPPTDVEGFTHRSGRTGRAGQQGTSIMLVPPAARERVRNVLRRARVEPQWCQVPTPDEVHAAADDRLIAELTAAPAESDHRELAERLVAEHAADPARLVAALLTRAGHGGPCEPHDVAPVEREAPRAPRSDFVAFRINWGLEHGADPRRLLAMVCRRGRIRGDQVGAIRIFDEESTFEVVGAVASDFAYAAKRRDPRDARVFIEALRPERRGPARGGHRDKGGWGGPDRRPQQRDADARA
jgi:ATP-dependent RNA helicase DeaD